MREAMTEIVGNRTLCERLAQDIEQGSLSHAYIIEGSDGSGRKTLALTVAASLACENRHSSLHPIPCMKCNSCRRIFERKTPDVIFVKDESRATVGVDVIRSICETVRIVPNDFDDKFYIIENADKMTPEAQNAFLLTLEEPPAFVHFFLICNSADYFLDTVRSRSITLRMQRLTDAQIKDFICANDTRASQMNLSSPSELAEIIKASHGGIGQALAFLDRDTWQPIHERRELIRSFLQKAVSSASAPETVSLLLKFSSKRDMLCEELSLLATATRDLIAVKNADSPRLEFYCDANEAIELSDKTSLSYLYKLYESIDTAICESEKNANVRLMMIKLAMNASLL